MRFDEWEPFYESILEEFGYSREEDRRAARVLDGYAEPFDTDRLYDVFRDETIVVVGDAPSLEPSRVPKDAVVVAADAAGLRLGATGTSVDAIVTDLDGAPEYAAEASEDTAVVVHAHGDNPDAVERWLPRFNTRNVVGTTQTRHFGDLHNFGGFTDGDRAAFLADEFGASRIELVGFDFGAATGEKRRKLRWARRLLRVLGEKRGERIA